MKPAPTGNGDPFAPPRGMDSRQRRIFDPIGVGNDEVEGDGFRLRGRNDGEETGERGGFAIISIVPTAAKFSCEVR